MRGYVHRGATPHREEGCYRRRPWGAGATARQEGKRALPCDATYGGGHVCARLLKRTLPVPLADWPAGWANPRPFLQCTWMASLNPQPSACSLCVALPGYAVSLGCTPPGLLFMANSGPNTNGSQ